MVNVQRSFVVDKPIDVVVDYLKDFAHAEAWDPGTRTCTQTSSGPVAVGTTWRNVSKFAGREVEITYTLKTLEPDHIVLVGTNDSSTSTDDMTFATEGSGTRVTYDADIVLHGIVKLADPFLKPGFNKLGDETEKQMTEVINGL